MANEVELGTSTHSFGLDDASDAGVRISGRQAALGIGLVVVLLGLGVWFAFIGEPSSSAHPTLFGDSVVLSYDGKRPVVADLAAGTVPLGLNKLDENLGTTRHTDLRYISTDVGTYFYSPNTKKLNLLGPDALLRAKAPKELTGGGQIHAYGTRDGVYVTQPVDNTTSVYLIDETAITTGAEGAKVALPGTPPDATTDDWSLAPAAREDGASAVTARGDLYVLTSNGNEASLRHVRRSAEPANTTKLETEDLLTLPAKTTLGSNGDQVAAIAPDGRIVTIDGTTKHDLGLHEELGGSTLLPAHGDGGDLLFLARTRAGEWRVVRITARDVPEVLINQVADIDGGRALAVPAAVGGSLYTLDDHGTPYSIDGSSGVTSRVSDGSYPISSAKDQRDDTTSYNYLFAKTDVEVRGPRVVINAAASSQALLIRTDEDGSTSVLDKSSAKNIDPGSEPSPDVKKKETQNEQQQQQQTQAKSLADEQHDCSSPDQKPRKPKVLSAQAEAKAVRITWSYKLEDSSDCYPGTYFIQVEATDGGDQPSDVRRQRDSASFDFRFDGLKPNRTYRVTVSARIGDNETASEPYDFRTAEAGPDEPKTVTVSTDRPGGWQVNWTTCEGAECDVPATGFTIKADACDRGGLPPDIVVPPQPKDARNTFIPFNGNRDLAGVTARFVVTALGPNSTTSSQTSNCATSWAEPDQAQIELSGEATTLDDGQAELKVAVTPKTSRPQSAFGGVDPTFEFLIDGKSDGPPTSATVHTFAGLAPNREDVPVTVVVRVRSAKAEVERRFTIQGRQWNVTSADIRLETTGDPTSGTVTMSVDAVPPNADLVFSVSFACGERSAPELTRAVPAGTKEASWSVDLANQPLCEPKTAEIREDVHAGKPSTFNPNFRTLTPEYHRSVPLPSDQIGAVKVEVQPVTLTESTPPRYAVTIAGSAPAGVSAEISKVKVGTGGSGCEESPNAPLGAAGTKVTVDLSCALSEPETVEVTIRITWMGVPLTRPFAVSASFPAPPATTPGEGAG